MRASMNTSMNMQFAWSNGRSAPKAAFRRRTCGFVFTMPGSDVSSKPWQLQQEGRNA